MIGIISLLAFSWILLFVLEKQSLLALGLLPVDKRIKQFCVGFGITAILCVAVQFLEAYLKDAHWVLNEEITTTLFVNSFWWDLKSVLTEELIFRGALLYLLIKKIGAGKAVLISAVAFGIYHWFSYGVFGNIMPMIFVFIGTGLMGYAWAWAFAKTNSMLLGTGLHLGWNFCYNTLFSKGPLGAMVFISKGGYELADWPSLLNFLSGLILVPVLVLLYIKFGVRKETDQHSPVSP